MSAVHNPVSHKNYKQGRKERRGEGIEDDGEGGKRRHGESQQEGRRRGSGGSEGMVGEGRGRS